jgi:L,D-transpeptidase YcbB
LRCRVPDRASGTSDARGGRSENGVESPVASWRIGDVWHSEVVDGPASIRRCSVAIGVVSLALSGCSDGSALVSRSRDSASRLQSVRSADDRASSVDLRRLIGALIDGRDSALGALTRAERADLEQLYQSDNDAPLWLDAADRATRNGRDALTLLGHAADEGLDPAEYYQELLGRLIPRVEAAATAPSDLASFDVAVSAGMLRYLRHVHMGRVDPRAIGFRLEVPRDQHDFPALLRSAMAQQRVTDTAADLRPPLAQYRALRDMLARYRSLANDPTIVAPPSITTAIHPEDVYGGIGALQHELVALGDLSTDTPAPRESGRYEGALVDGVKRFQTRHGLEADGVLGKSTIGALRVPLAWRVRQIELALERFRWLPHLGDERLIALNIPMFRLWAWDIMPSTETPLFGMDVIVGRALSTQTPVFVAQMGEVIFRPYWNVPQSILRHEVLPRIERDPEYLSREAMEIVRGAGDNASRVDLTADALAGLRQGGLRVRQRPGQHNALGLIKFVFPNREDVYMHGTPAQALFARSRRDFSHGCVRVADPVALAEWVLQDQPAWTRERILAATMGPQTIHVRLARPIQVILFYTTAAVMPEDGTVRFAEDIYRHDARLDRALAMRRLAQ